MSSVAHGTSQPRRLASRLLSAAILCHTSASAQVAPTLEPPPDSLRPRLVARRATGAIRLDGRLDEPDWAAAATVTDWPTVRPDYTPRAKMRTIVRVVYDARALYVAAEMEDSAAADGFRVQDLARDFNFSENENFGVTLSGIGDRRTSYQFTVTPWGNLRDVEAFDGGEATNESWDALWSARTTRSRTGWIAELSIPWESLRYAPGATAWDVNFVRNARRTLETSAWSPYPRQFAAFRLTYAGVVDSLTPPPPRTNVRMRPYVLGEAIARGGTPTAPRSLDDVRQAGGEVIWAPTANTVVEGTLNTDFAQADVDRQVVNLTRFSVFFPERRQFFLESNDVLGARGLDGVYVVQPFFTRRIGLADDGTPIPVVGGGRATFRSARMTGGVLAMRQRGTATTAPTTFGVARASRFFGTSTNVGGLVAVRHEDAMGGVAGGSSVVTAVDGLTRIGEQIQINGMLSTATRGDTTGFAATYFAGRDTPGLYTGILGAYVTRDYAPATGFVSRSNVLLTSPAVVSTWQPRWRPQDIVWFRPALVTYFYHDPRTLSLQEGWAQAYVDVLHRDGALWYPFIERNWQRPTAPVALFPSVTVPQGSYDYWRGGLVFATDRSAPASVRVDLSTGGFFDGALDRASGTARWAPDPRIAAALNFDISRLRRLGLTDTTFVTQLYGPELRLAASPRLQVVSFYQYNTAANAAALNARLSWEFSPLSFLYVIWNQREPFAAGTTRAQNALLVKLSWLTQL